MFLQPVLVNLAWRAGLCLWAGPPGGEKAVAGGGSAAVFTLKESTSGDWSQLVIILRISGFLHPRMTKPRASNVVASTIVAELLM